MSRVWIRRTVVRIPGSGSVLKRYGSGTLVVPINSWMWQMFNKDSIVLFQLVCRCSCWLCPAAQQHQNQNQGRTVKSFSPLRTRSLRIMLQIQYLLLIACRSIYRKSVDTLQLELRRTICVVFIWIRQYLLCDKLLERKEKNRERENPLAIWFYCESCSK